MQDSKQILRGLQLPDSVENELSVSSLHETARRGQKRQRVLVNHNAIAEEAPETQNEYEQERAERIKRNADFIQQLGLKRLAASLEASMHSANPVRPKAPKQKRQVSEIAAAPRCRMSTRKHGEEADTRINENQEDAPDNPGPGALLELDEYFAQAGKAVEGHRVTGTFEGWVDPKVCERYGLASNADDAWESNGGGKFTFKIDKKAIPASLKGKGWSDARAFSATQLCKNPNAYFYRHVAPHERQACGEWTEEEHNLFLETAKKHGVGTKWGLFSSYIPQRVGYQCSAYYREVIIPQGLIFDAKFKMSHNGRAVYIG